MTINNLYSKYKFSLNENINLFVLCFIPIVALLGNAISDIYLVLVIVFSLYYNKKHFLSKLYCLEFISLFIFWVWIVICSLLSNNVLNSIAESIPWIRFPLYSCALIVLISYNINYINIFVNTSIVGTIIQAFFVFYEKLQNFEKVRLYGTFGKLKAGWYFICFSLISILYIFENRIISFKYYIKNSLYVFYIIVCIISVILTGEIFNNILFFSSLILYLIVNKKYSKINIYFVTGYVITLIIIFIIFKYNYILIERYIDGFANRLPWKTTSDYHDGWIGGLRVAFDNFYHGIGPKNYYSYCLFNLEEMKIGHFNVKECLWHPHNIFIQIFAETGIVGLFLFLIPIVIIMYKSILKYFDGSIIEIILCYVLFFPISTYSQAFGQHKNFFWWTAFSLLIYMINKEDKNIQNEDDIDSRERLFISHV